MSRINRIRLCNVNYNSGNIHIQDETLNLMEENTLITLRNGGGKSVFVQLISSLFVHGKYQNRKDRPFESHFVLNEPSFILVEWALDNRGGYLLTGMMARKTSQSESNHMDKIQFICHYKKPCRGDIESLPIITESQGGRWVKGYGECRKMLDELSKDRELDFHVYDMSYKQKQYLDKLREYRIYSEEWEGITYKINREESGLSNLFRDSENEQQLLENWFIPAAEKKLNFEEDKIRQFRNNLKSQSENYWQVREKYRQKHVMNRFIQEMKQVQKLAAEYDGILTKKENTYNEAGLYRNKMTSLKEMMNEESQQCQYRVEELNGKRWQVQCEKESFELHRESDTLNQLKKQISKREDQLNFLKVEIDENHNELNYGEALRIREEMQEYESRLEKVEAMLEACREEEKDLEPEIRRLGSILHLTYSTEKEASEKNKLRLEKRLTQLKKRIDALEDERKTKEERLQQLREEKGRIAGRTEGYDRAEAAFNSDFKENLARNLLRIYDDQFLEKKREEITDESKSSENRCQSLRESKQNIISELEELKQHIVQFEKQDFQLQLQKKQLDNQKQNFTKRLDERNKTIKYIEYEGDPYNTDDLITAIQERLDIQEARINDTSQQARLLRKKKERLESGRNVQLEEGIIQDFEKQNIRVTYGLEWLRKNRRSYEENLNTLKANPMIPYSVIMNGNELNALQNMEDAAFTSYPVPVVLREELNRSKENKKDSVIQAKGFYLYSNFNEQLLNSEELQRQIKNLEDRCSTLEYQVIQMNGEREKLLAMKLITLEDGVSKQEKTRIDSGIEDISIQTDKVKTELNRCKDRELQLKKELEQKVQDIEKAVTLFEMNKKRAERFKELIRLYEGFLKDLAEEKKNVNAIERLVADLDAIEKDRKASENHKEKTASELSHTNRELQDAAEGLSRFQSYVILDGSEPLNLLERKKAEGRFDAITQQVSGNIKQLETSRQQHSRDLEGKRDQLEEFCRINNLQVEDLKDRRYSWEHQKDLRETIDRLNDKLILQEREFRKEVSKMDRKAGAFDNRLRQYKDRFKRDSLMDKGVIRNVDFGLEIKGIEEKIYDETERRRLLSDKIQICENAISMLYEFQVEDGMEEVPVSMPERQQVKSQVQMYQNLYKKLSKEQNRLRADINQCLGEMLLCQDYRTGTYEGSLHRLKEVIAVNERKIEEDANNILECYLRLNRQIEKDLENRENEKRNMVNNLLEYVHSLNDEISKIDSDSTIKIDGKSRKMLNIEIPPWDENREAYLQRMDSFVTSIDEKSSDILDRGESVEDFLSSIITASSLFDQVVGVGNADIRIYKVEQNRQYKIRWSDVRKNSGGEGFLSAFIILSSLLQYMRKDERDIFADRKEGKVLLMDNPFAETQSGHLLEPMMELAKKTRTQLICLTAIESEEISKRFDNIYVLTVESMLLSGGRDMLTAEKKKGETISSSFIREQPTEQIKLF